MEDLINIICFIGFLFGIMQIVTGVRDSIFLMITGVLTVTLTLILFILVGERRYKEEE